MAFTCETYTVNAINTVVYYRHSSSALLDDVTAETSSVAIHSRIR